MAYAANLRGWGPGWPTNRIKDQVWVQAQRSRVRFHVHHGIAPIIKFLIDEVERRGYLLHVPGQTPDDWSFNSRPIRGTNRPSNHSWGLAIDIDATEYPQGQRRNQPQRWVIDLFRAYGFEYGGDWSNPDPMHLEFAGSVSEARWLVAALAASHVVKQPAPVPATVPPPYVPPLPITKQEAIDMAPFTTSHKDYGTRVVLAGEDWQADFGMAAGQEAKGLQHIPLTPQQLQAFRGLFPPHRRVMA